MVRNQEFFFGSVFCFARTGGRGKQNYQFFFSPFLMFSGVRAPPETGREKIAEQAERSEADRFRNTGDATAAVRRRER